MVIVVASGGRPFAGSAGAWLKEHQPGSAARVLALEGHQGQAAARSLRGRCASLDPLPGPVGLIC